ncbi:DUF6766 family protein [Sphingomonas sp. LaA6.9]|uniref:DUF6766 family protein n=1 Tax=Sphingomonas sp. LaA6.9 TaxID=2919914 RepID=UPI001F4F65D7|nr:DUF6766 family protein [Sphingomonas sp. LaA6.9]MCJ8157077.1 hypothetical protein [Sphingomonas sp. LaA6.9]
MRLLRDNSLTLILLLLFAISLIGQWLAGWHFNNSELVRHHQSEIGPVAFLRDPLFLSSVFENWESEFLQMSAYVMLTAVLMQRGSAESRDPDAPLRDGDLAKQARKAGAPAILRAGALWRWLYARSLGIVLFMLFGASFTLHLVYSAQAAAAEAAQHGDTAEPIHAYLFSAQLWFESFQNWQSEFLSTAVLIVLSIFLRQRESPESKPVAAPHSQTGA